MALPPELEMAGAQAQEAEDAAFEAAAPTGKYSARALNQVVKSLNAVLPLFGVAAYPEFTEDQTQLPVEFVKQLTMAFKAADESGVMGDVDLTRTTDDRGLLMLAGKLDVLAKSRDFRDWVKSPPEKKVEPEDKMPMNGKPEGEMPMGEDEMDSLMMSRA